MSEKNGVKKSKVVTEHLLRVGRVFQIHTNLRDDVAEFGHATKKAECTNKFLADMRALHPGNDLYDAVALPDWFLKNANLVLFGLPTRGADAPKSNSGRTNLRITQRHLIEKQAEDIAHKALLEGICAEIKQLLPKSKLGKLLEQYETTLGNSLSGEIARRIPCCLGGDAGTEHMIALDTWMQENLPK